MNRVQQYHGTHGRKRFPKRRTHGGRTVGGMPSVNDDHYICLHCGVLQSRRKVRTMLFMRGNFEVRLVGKGNSCIRVADMVFYGNEVYDRTDQSPWMRRTAHFCDWDCFIEWARNLKEDCEQAFHDPEIEQILDPGHYYREEHTKYIEDQEKLAKEKENEK